MPDDRKFSVSQITERIKNSLEAEFGSVLIEGEISNCKPYPSGHIYLTLKDTNAVISAVMFKNYVRSLNFKPKDGTSVLAHGSIQVYPPRGGYQLVITKMEELDKTGDILAMLERRKRLLAGEGLFDEERKQPIPRFPSVIGVVTSPRGAAIRDILQVLGRRAAGIRVIVLPAPVQGEEAAPLIARRIEQANQWKLCDVLIVGRGGGAMEDLLPFSEEAVVRAIAGSKIPVVSAVGHEIDWSLSDFAADLRAPTPSAAAELVSENHAETLAGIRHFSAMLRQATESRLERARLLIRPFGIENLEQRFRMILQPRLIRFDDAKEELLDSMRETVENRRRRLELLKTRLESASPRAILERGYSVVVNTSTGKLLRRAGEVKAGDLLSIRLLEGSVRAQALEPRAHHLKSYPSKSAR
ncbi:MAG: exodeoxyribonuclease VII large subunit [Spirochaetaceae bacterium]|jgi:exodeoxyribonuclease VII large subunit|nr:exodeoxyribonuclease VII large subunit [Spirochaetaceae bacterium]